MRYTPTMEVTIDGFACKKVGEGTYGTVWTYYNKQTDEELVVKILRGHELECSPEGFHSVDSLLYEQQLVMLNFPPSSIESAAKIAGKKMWMHSPEPVVLKQEESGRVTFVNSPRNALSRWAPIVLLTEEGAYPLFRDADLCISEIRDLFPRLLHVEAIVPAAIKTITINQHHVFPGIVMPRLFETHADFFMRDPPQEQVNRMLTSWAHQIIPLVATFLDEGIILGDLQVQNIMLYSNDTDNFQSGIIDPDSIFRESSATWLEPAVGVVSLIPSTLRAEDIRFHRDVLRYAMVFAALVSTLPVSKRPRHLIPAYSARGVMRAHRVVMNSLSPEAQELVNELLGDTSEMAEMFANLVFPN